MICGYCRAKNSEEDHRCVRCGRRLHHAAPRPAPETYPVIHGAAAPQLRMETAQAAEAARPHIAPPRETTPSGSGAAIQASLFGPQAVPRPREIPAPRAEKRVQPAPRAPRKAAAPGQQQSLDLLPPTVGTRSPDAVVQCSARVAPLVLRMVAAAVDAAVVLTALGLFLGALSFGGVDIVLKDQVSLGIYGAAAVLIALLYKGFFVLANGDSVGARTLRIRVVNFDGHRPTARQRAYRFAGGCLGLMAATLGMLWALVDEESLTWHDHISKTFPTAAP